MLCKIEVPVLKKKRGGDAILTFARFHLEKGGGRGRGGKGLIKGGIA